MSDSEFGSIPGPVDHSGGVREPHTPGPWSLADIHQGPYVCGSSRAVAAIVHGFARVMTLEEEANAALIIAAPDLLAALRECLAFIDSIEGDGYGGMSEYMCAQESARVAIAKAVQP